MIADRQDTAGPIMEVHGIIYGRKKIWIMPQLILRLVSCIYFVVFFPSSNLGAFELSGGKWPAASTMLHVDIPGENGLWNSAFEEAAEKWNSATVFNFIVILNSSVDPCRNPNLLPPMNGTKFDVTVCGDAWGHGTLAVTKSCYSGSEIIQSGIFFNDNLNWDVYSGQWEKPGYQGINDFRRVAVHELGHVMGLSHEDDVPAIMGTYVGNYEDPQPDDIEGVNTLYMSPPPDDPDNDGLNSTEEVNLNTDPNDHDTDGDGLNDNEDAAPLDPDADDDGIVD